MGTIQTPIQYEQETPLGPVAPPKVHVICRYPELDPSYAERVVELEVESSLLTAAEARELCLRLAEAAFCLEQP